MEPAANSEKEKISTISELLERLGTYRTGDFIFRGQADAKWKLKSGAVRRVQGKSKWNKDDYPSSDDVLDYVQELISNARSLGLEFHGSLSEACRELKILAELQHHGAATNLIDFSRNILIALWMVCSGEPGADGRIFVVDLFDENIEELEVGDADCKSVDELFRENKIRVWTPERFVSRIQSQASVFVIAPDEGRIPCREIIIAKGAKQRLLKELAEKFALTEAQVYPDLPGFARSNRVDAPRYARDIGYYLQLSLKYVRQQNFPMALRALGKATNIDPENSAVWFRKGYCSGELKKYKDALTYYDKAIELDPKYAAAYNNRGNAKADLGNQEEALADYDKAIELDPKNAAAYNNRGYIKNESGNREGALADYDKAIELDPKYAIAYYNRGNAKTALGNQEEALADYDKAIELDPKYAAAYNNRGYAKTALGNQKDALADYDKAIELDPKYAAAYWNKSLLLEAMGELDKAVACCREYCRLMPDDRNGTERLARLEKKVACAK